MSIRQRGNSYQVTYRCPGEKAPRTETYKNHDEALIRDAQIKLAKKLGTFITPARTAKQEIVTGVDITVRDFLNEYVEVYGLKRWGPSYYSACLGLIKNYINPYLGSRSVRSIEVRDMDQYYSLLLTQPAVVTAGHMDTGARITAHTVSRIHKLLKSAFSKAVAWKYADVNPTQGVTLPEAKSQKRAVWSDEEAVRALTACDNDVLKLCLYLALGCSLRLGEILGLQWKNVHIEEDLTGGGEAFIRIDRELKRCSNESIERLEQVNRSTVLFKFPRVVPKKATTALVLKAPKTESSNRIIYLPLAVVEELRKARVRQEGHRGLLGDEYQEFDLVVAQINGRPYEQRIIDKMFADLIKVNNLRPVVFHSLRHSSTSLKLKLSKGNIKAVQGDTGHAEARMVTDTYAHGFDSDRKIIAQEMDSGFFSKVGVEHSFGKAENTLMDQLKQLIQSNPELVREMLGES